MCIKRALPATGQIVSCRGANSRSVETDRHLFLDHNDAISGFFILGRAIDQRVLRGPLALCHAKRTGLHRHRQRPGFPVMLLEGGGRI